MPGGFTSPAILFLNTWDAPERAFCRQVFESLRKSGGYTRFVEPCCGAFAMPLVAHNAGWLPSEMETSDSSLFSSIVGYMLADKPFKDLGVKWDGKAVRVQGRKPIEKAAHLLWFQLLARTKARPDVEYWRSLVEDLEVREAAHRKAIQDRLASFLDRLGGLSYEPRDMWSHIESVMDDPHTVVSINPPTYKAGFERFFDTKGRLTWNVPEYDIFDPDVGIPKLVSMMEGKAALLMCQQQREPGNSAHKVPVFARDLSLGQVVYLNSNRPDEVFAITGGPKVAPRKAADLTPANVAVLPADHEITSKSVVGVVPVGSTVADYYRGLWMHRLKADPGGLNLLMVVDGYAAGVLGYNAAPMQNSYNQKWAKHIILRFAFGAPHNEYRLTRLATMMALSHHVVNQAVTPTNSIVVAASKGLVTIEYTRHPEAKGLRGLMKLADRTPRPEGHRLIYSADWTNDTPAEVTRKFLAKEASWRRSSQKQPA
jgi:hypothetical protein